MSSWKCHVYVKMRDRAVGMVHGGIHHIDVAEHFGVSRLTIVRLMSRVRATAITADRLRSGRPKFTTLRQDRQIRLVYFRDRFLPATVMANRTPVRHNPWISAQTLCNTLRAYGLRSRRPCTGPTLKRRHRTARLLWSITRLIWYRQRWQNVIFSDE